MKKIFLLQLTTVIFSSYFNLEAQWVQTNGPTGAQITCFAASGNNLYAGTNSGKIYLSTNNGMNWNITTTTLSSDNISHVYSLSASGSTLLAGTDRGVYISHNYGATWIHLGLTQRDVGSVYIYGGTLFANINHYNTEGGLFHSTDNGNSWTPDSVRVAIWDSTGIFNIIHESIYSPAFTEYRGGLLAGGGSQYLHLKLSFSTDNGMSWVAYPSPPSQPGNISSLAVQGSNVYAACLGDGVYLSWNPIVPDYFFSVNNGLTYSSNVRALACSGGPILAGTYGGGIFRSDNGSSWYSCNSGLTNLYVNALIYNGENLFAGTNSGIFRSTNNGLNWTSANSGIFASVLSLTQLGNKLFAGTEHCGTFVSTNDGIGWNKLNSVSLEIPSYPGFSFTLDNVSVNSLAWSSNSVTGSILYAGIDGGMVMSTDYGNSWSLGYYGNFVNSFAIDPSNTSIIFAGTSAGVYSSIDRGRNWSVKGLTDTKVNAIAVKDQFVIAGTSKGIYFSNDPSLRFSGESIYIFWIPTWSDPVSALYISGINIIQGTSSGVHVSVDGGGGWIDRNTGLINKEYVKAFTMKDNNLFAATFGGGVFLSTNFGITWNGVNTGLNEYDVSSLTVSDNFLYVGTYWGGVWRRPLSEIVTSVKKENEESPTKFELNQNYPNPFNPTTKIKFGLPETALTQLIIYDLLGKEIKILFNMELEAGYHEISFDGSKMPSGIYFYKIQAGEFMQTKKMILLK
ncbi:MAG: T9SS type A sorting domain-containing protein [Ignavibacteriales bacterium]|nr:T9SS type A sorting domain-containing protein [Ignavibacteriales bacterium]